MNQTSLGKYTLLEPLGSGAFGSVYRATDALGRQVAVKILKPAWAEDAETLARFQREARAAGELFHPHIASILDFDETNGKLFIVMRYIEGPALDKLLKAHGPLDWPTALRYLQETAAGLDYAHQRGFVHRDVKPANILISERDGAVLTDFGLVKAAQSSGLSVSGVLMGTPNYIAPEVWEGKEATPATDVYSLACTFYEMLTGKKLFDGDSAAQIMTRHVLEGPRFPESWPAALPAGAASVLHRALARNPADRYASPGAFAAALAACAALPVADTPHREPPPPIQITPPPPPRADPPPPAAVQLPPACEQMPYAQPLSLPGQPAGVEHDWRLMSPAPYWLAIDRRGQLTGTPPPGAAGSLRFTIQCDKQVIHATLNVLPGARPRQPRTMKWLLPCGCFGLLSLAALGLLVGWLIGLFGPSPLAAQPVQVQALARYSDDTIAFDYPEDWVLSADSAPVVLFLASSPDAATVWGWNVPATAPEAGQPTPTPPPPLAGAGLYVYNDFESQIFEIPPEMHGQSPEDALRWFIAQEGALDSVMQLENWQTLATADGRPAAVAYGPAGESWMGEPAWVYIALAPVDGRYWVLVIGGCAQADWPAARFTFESVLTSMVITPPAP